MNPRIDEKKLISRLARLSPRQRAALERELAKRGADAAQLQNRIPRILGGDLVPLSNAQRRLWILGQMDGGVEAYNMPGAYEVVGDLDEEGFEWALRALLARHESLRTQIEVKGGDPVQVIREVEELDFGVEKIDWRGIEGLEERLEALVLEEAIRAFDLEKAPLMRAKLVRLEEKKRALLFTMHHIVSDGWSMGVLVRDVGQLYEGYLVGKRSHEEVLEPLRVHYKDYSAWQRERLDGEKGEEDFKYWKEKLDDGAIESLDIPMDKSRGRKRTYRGAGVSRVYGADQLEKLKALAQEEGCTVFMVLMGVTKVLLRRYSGQRGITVGTGIAGRDHVDLEDQIGFYVNTLVLRDELELKESFLEVLGKVKETMVGAYEHGDYPYDRLVEELEGVERDMSRNPLFDVLVMMGEQWAEGSGGKLSLGGVEFRPLESKERTAKFDWTLSFNETTEGLSLDVEFNRDLYEEWRMEGVLGHFENLVESILKDPLQEIGRLSLLGEAEARKLLVEFNDTKTEHQQDKTVIELFEEQVLKTPDRIAVISGKQELTYQQFNEKANQLGHYLREEHNVGSEVCVGLLVGRRMEMMVALFAILKAGGAYVPMDPEYPQERIDYMVADAGLRVVLSHKEYLEKIPVGTKGLNLEDEELYKGCSVENLEVLAKPESLAYIIYTSGSTGRAKGVMVEHRALVSHVLCWAQEFEITERDCVAQLASIAFDASVEQIFPSLIVGASIWLKGAGVLTSEELVCRIQLSNITVLDVTPSYFQQVCNEKMRAIRALTLGGEPLNYSQIQMAGKLLRKLEIFNVYGPTEAVISATLLKLDLSSLPLEGNVPIGKVIGQRSILLLDAMELLPLGYVGEICIAGESIARGYLNDSGLTREKFVENPYCPGERMYRTGDLGRWLPDGNLEYLGRRDDQVKIRGNRIELGDVEVSLSGCEGVEQAAVVTRDDGAGAKQLCGYYVGVGCSVSQEAVLEELREKLPRHMIPTQLMELEAMPLTGNGKLNRKALPEPEWGEFGRNEYEAPVGELEEKLAEIWQEVLGVEKVGRNDDFFGLGGTSLSALRLVATVKQQLELDVVLRGLFEQHVFKELAEKLKGSEASVYEEIAVQPEAESYPLSNAQRRLWILGQMDGGVEAYNMPGAYEVVGDLDEEGFEWALRALLARHESLRTQIEVRGGDPVQVIRGVEELDFGVEKIDWRGVEGLEERLEALVLEEARRAFDLEKAPLMRAKLVRLEEKKRALLFTMHHIVSDGWSSGVLERDVGQLYEGYLTGKRSYEEVLEPLRVHYKDYSAWQRERLKGERGVNDLKYWQRKLSQGSLEPLDLPADRPRSISKTYRGAGVSRIYGKEMFAKLQALAQKEECTLFMVLMAMTKVLLRRYTQQDEIVVGTVIAGRDHTDLQDQIGFYVNTLVLRDELALRTSFKKVLSQVKQTLMEAYAHCEYPFDRLVEELPELARDISRNPLFEVLVMMDENWSQDSGGKLGLAGVEIEEIKRRGERTAKFDWALTFGESEQGLSLDVEYNRDVYDEWRMEALLGHFSNLLENTIQNPAEEIGKLELMDEAEKHKLIVEFNDNQTDFSQNKTVIQLFEEQVEKTPNKVAVIYEEQGLTYRELSERVNQLGGYLRKEHQVGPEVCVGMLVERSMEMMVGILGILKAGGAYVPMDVEYPQERIDYMVEDASMEVVLSHNEHLDKVPSRSAAIDLGKAEIYENTADANANLKHETKPENLVYIIYTSGSTGRPKGVMVEQRGIVNFLYSLQSRCPIDSEGAYLLKTTYTFDVSVSELFGWFLGGGHLVIMPSGKEKDPVAMLEALDLQRVTHLNFVSSMLRVVMEIDRNMLQKCFASLRYMMVAGEAFLPSLARRWQELEINGHLENLYGPTETCVYVSGYQLQKAQEDVVPIGQPLANTQSYVLDRLGRSVPQGVVGEMCFGGVQVARGYLNDPILTSKKFVENPYRPGERIYRTGDLGRWLPDGNLEYRGRMDDQVKIRGYRIELGEIEAALSACPGVGATTIQIFKDRSGADYICAYYTGRKKQHNLISRLRERLPHYMIPSQLVWLKMVPLTKNGKVDKKALPEPKWGASGREYVVPVGEVEEKIAKIWGEVLGVERVGRNDNFFDLGGNSLKAMSVLRAINSDLRIDTKYSKLAEHSQFKSFCRELNEPDLMNNLDILELSSDVVEYAEPSISTSLNDYASYFRSDVVETSEPVGSFGEWYIEDNRRSLMTSIRELGRSVSMLSLKRSIFSILQENPLLRSTVVKNEIHYYNIYSMVCFDGFKIPGLVFENDIEARRYFANWNACVGQRNVCGDLLFCVFVVKIAGKHYVMILMDHLIADQSTLDILNRIIFARKGDLLATSYFDYKRRIIDNELGDGGRIKVYCQKMRHFRGSIIRALTDMDSEISGHEIVDVRNVDDIRSYLLACIYKKVSHRFGVQEVVLRVLVNHRVFHNGIYRNTIGDLHDSIPIYMSSGSTGMIDSEIHDWKEYIEQNEINIHSLAYNNLHIREGLFKLCPISVNFVRYAEEEEFAEIAKEVFGVGVKEKMHISVYWNQNRAIVTYSKRI